MSMNTDVDFLELIRVNDMVVYWKFVVSLDTEVFGHIWEIVWR